MPDELDTVSVLPVVVEISPAPDSPPVMVFAEFVVLIVMPPVLTTPDPPAVNAIDPAEIPVVVPTVPSVIVLVVV